jgi:hypothetical protein
MKKLKRLVKDLFRIRPPRETEESLERFILKYGSIDLVLYWEITGSEHLI